MRFLVDLKQKKNKMKKKNKNKQLNAFSQPSLRLMCVRQATTYIKETKEVVRSMFIWSETDTETDTETYP